MDFTGRPMRGYVFIAARGCDTTASVVYWVRRAIANIESMSDRPTKSVKQR